MELRRLQVYNVPFMSDCVFPIPTCPMLALGRDGGSPQVPPTHISSSSLHKGSVAATRARLHLLPLPNPIFLPSVAERSLPRRLFSPHPFGQVQPALQVYTIVFLGPPGDLDQP